VAAKARADKAKKGPDLDEILGAPNASGNTVAAQPASQVGARKERKTRAPITDPVVLEKRKAALAKARAVRAEKLAAAGTTT
jgi:hypothetical protein